MSWFTGKILSLLAGPKKSVFKKGYKNFMFRSLKKKIEEELKNKILTKYGSEPFYNTFHLFLSRNKIFENLFGNQNNTGIHKRVSITEYTNLRRCLWKILILN